MRLLGVGAVENSNSESNFTAIGSLSAVIRAPRAGRGAPDLAPRPRTDSPSSSAASPDPVSPWDSSSNSARQ